MTSIPDAAWAQALPLISRVARQRGLDPATAEDVAQRAIEKAMRRAHTLQDHGKFEAWLKRIAANEAIDEHRTRRRHPPTAPLEQAHEVAAPTPEGDPLLSFSGCVRPFLDRLPPADAEALRLKDLSGLRFTELAEVLSLSLPGAKSRVQRARRRLAAELAACCAELAAAPVRDPLPEHRANADCCAAAPQPESSF